MKCPNCKSEDGKGADGVMIDKDQSYKFGSKNNWRRTIWNEAYAKKIIFTDLKEGYYAMNSIYENLEKEAERWFDTWFSNKSGKDCEFPLDKKEWLKLAFIAGFNSGRLISNNQK